MDSPKEADFYDRSNLRPVWYVLVTPVGSINAYWQSHTDIKLPPNTQFLSGEGLLHPLAVMSKMALEPEVEIPHTTSCLERPRKLVSRLPDHNADERCFRLLLDRARRLPKRKLLDGRWKHYNNFISEWWGDETSTQKQLECALMLRISLESLRAYVWPDDVTKLANDSLCMLNAPINNPRLRVLHSLREAIAALGKVGNCKMIDSCCMSSVALSLIHI